MLPAMRDPQPRRHHHLSRRAIAEAGLAIIDAEGPKALNLRGVATSLGIGTMTLYTYVESRDALISDIVGLLLNEVDISPLEGETWDASVRRVTRSVRQMACRHPRAFELVAIAPIDESPILEYAQAIDRLHENQGIPEERFVPMWGVIDSFLTGFLLMETQALTRERPTHATYEGASTPPPSVPPALSESTFETALETIIAGLRQTVMRDFEG